MFIDPFCYCSKVQCTNLVRTDLDSSTPLSENGASPIFRPWFGAWQGKWGESVLELILQQAGARVTGQVNVNSANLGVIMDGIVVGNTLRFNIMRARRGLPNRLPDEFVGSGEVVMDADGKSFKGHISGTAVTGTWVGR